MIPPLSLTIRSHVLCSDERPLSSRLEPAKRCSFLHAKPPPHATAAPHTRRSPHRDVSGETTAERSRRSVSHHVE